MRLLSAIMLFFPLLCFAQQNAVFKSVKVVPTTLPATCIAGDMRVSSAGSDVLSYCNPSNTWNTILNAVGSLTFSGGDIIYSTGTALALAPAGTSGQLLRSGGSGAPTWATTQAFSGYHQGDCDWSNTSNTLAEAAADGSCTFSQRTNYNFPTVTGYNSGQMGIQFTAAAADIVYSICAIITQANDTAGTAQSYYLKDQSVSTIASKNSRTTTTGGGSVGFASTVPLCGVYVTPAAQTLSFRVWSTTTAGTTNMTGAGIADSISWSILKVGGP